MSKYHFNDIEAKWQQYWDKNQTFKAENTSDKPKYYVLDMFPYPSGAGLHVGHPLGYIASDIYARYKRHKGFNVLHPQGYDSFGLPAEQYAIQTGQHPADTTKVNIEGGVDKAGNKIAGYRKQLDKIGFSFDWSREVRTSNPEYYKWTQWIFTQLFESWYNTNSNKAEGIETLVAHFEKDGNATVQAVCDENIEDFSAEMWNSFSETKQQQILLQYRLTYLAETEVNWCPALGTVLANDEIVNGVSERGGHTVVRKKMTQWSMRISAYAERLLQGLETIDWSESLKETQRNWIGKSVGATVKFRIQNSEFRIPVFTTRPDTIFGVSFMTLAPEHELVAKITTDEQRAEVEAYVLSTSKRSERERMADVKTISGVFTGAYAEHPFTKEPIPVWIGDYVLAGYGTGAVMAVPCGDQRDYDFATKFGIPIPNVFEGVDISEAAHADKEGTVIANSDFLNGLKYKKAVKLAIHELEKLGAGEGKTNYRLRDAVFSRQRYWGEPFPVYYVDGMPQMIAKEHLPIRLPEVEKYLPTEEGEPPLGRADVWAWDTVNNKVVSNELLSPLGGDREGATVFPLELNTMPGWAGSSWYFFRYMEDAMRDEVFASEEALDYWENVDLYIGGSEHATGHLLYSRFWVKFMKDRGFVKIDEPFKKLINQGMILGVSAIMPRSKYSIVCVLEDDDSTELPDEYYDFIYKIIENGKSIFLSDEILKRGTGFIHESLNLLDYCKQLIKENLSKINEILNSQLTEEYFYIRFGGHSKPRINLSFLKGVTNEINLENLKSAGNPEIISGIFLDGDGKEIHSASQKFIASREVEKMSKRWGNVVNPDDICEEYGADALRMYEMFLGPLEQAKPWNTAGLTGVSSFLKKLWKLYHSPPTPEGGFLTAEDKDAFYVNDSPSSEGLGEALKTLHKTIKKVEEDIENFSFNTSVSTFMIAVNELTALKCNARDILEPLAVLISPYAPHIAEELWSKLGHTTSISTAPFPVFDASHLVESSKTYPISFNGKMKFTIELSLDLSKDEIEAAVLANEKTQQYLNGREPKKVIVVPGKIVNIVG